MKYILDLGVIGIIGVMSYIGYKKGFIKVAFSLLSFILSIALALLLYKPVSNIIINKTSLPTSIEQIVEERLSSSTITQEETSNIVSNYYENAKNASIPVIASGISKTIIQIGCMILVFLITNIILMFFRFSGKLISKLPLIKQLNGILGFAYGLSKGVLLIYIGFAIISLIAPITDVNNIISLINTSIVSKIMYNNNLIFVIFS